MTGSAQPTTLPVAGGARVLAATWREILADRRAVAGILFLNGLAAAAGLVGPRLLGRIVDTVKVGADADIVHTIDRLALVILVLTVARTLLARYALALGYRFGERTAARIRERFLRRTLDLPVSLVERVSAGDLIARGSRDISMVVATLRRALPEVLVALVQALFLIVAVFVLNPLLGMCGMVFLVGITVALRWYLRRARSAYLAQAATEARLADVITSTARGARTIEALGLAAKRTQVAETALRDARTARLRTLRLRTVLFPSFDLSYALSAFGVLLVGGALHARGLLSLGTVVTAAVYLQQLSGPMDTVTLWVEPIQGAVASFARLEGLAEIPRVRQVSTAEPRDNRIELRNVCFAYDGRRDVLSNVYLTVQPGERLAIVGASGAGKSTLGKLLAGGERPRSGSVALGGVPIADMPVDRLRKRVVLVSQDHHLFHDTVRDNLLIATPDASEDELWDALAAVDARWATTLPHGLNTVLGTDIRLDGAQAQQLSLARVILADPHTVILDEATALLSPTMARATEQSLAKVLRGRTVIAIAHRLQTAHDVDRVAVMESGSILELGTHDDLVTADGAYCRLWRSWHGGCH